MADHYANVENIVNVVKYIRNVDSDSSRILEMKCSEEMKIDFDKIMNQDFDEEVLSDDTGYASDMRYDMDHVEKFVLSPEITERSY